ncbi:ParA family protein [Arthrobacter mobilis]|uniref:ParA family protein n=1 Tax=Arthrobacter mobilis TaxID=2724944 RepID=A0A7X6HFA7_9MICC|nr:ParA family protein [Arthrobacter mobilis]NKX54966.1 ParA family protein [Arthrobacter mobilis]
MQVVSISSLKGGVGKTSVTLGLASAALAAGIPTLVVDLDPHADATTGLGVRPSRQSDIGQLLRNVRRADLAANVASSGWVAAAAARQELPLGRQVLDVAVGSAYTGIYDRPDLRRRDLGRLAKLLSKVEGYALVLIDCPPSLNGLTRMAWMASNRVLLVAEPSLFSVAGTERTMRALDLFREEFAPELATAGVVANRVRAGSSEHMYRMAEMRAMFGDLLLEPAIAEQANWQQIQGAAHAIHQWPGEAARQAAGVFDDLLKHFTDSGRRRHRRSPAPAAAGSTAGTGAAPANTSAAAPLAEPAAG